jgi:hypothetical protein
VTNINILIGPDAVAQQAQCPGGRLALLAAGVAVRGRPAPAARRARHGDQAGRRGDRWEHPLALQGGDGGGGRQVPALRGRGLRARGFRSWHGTGQARPDAAQRPAAYATTVRSWAAACATYRGRGERPPRRGGGRGRRAARRPAPNAQRAR